MTTNKNCTVADTPNKGEQVRVYLVATGEVYEGKETYTRHDVLPPLCEAETLYTTPTALTAHSMGVQSAPTHQLVLSPLTSPQLDEAVAWPLKNFDNREELAHAAGSAAVRAFCVANGIVLSTAGV